MKLCECGCGKPTPISTRDHPKRGYAKGQPQRFILGHNRVSGSGKRYREAKTADGRSYEHIQVAVRALGKPLPEGAQVHHFNGNRRDNRPENLVVCQDAAYHKLLHRRQRALAACGNPAWMKCYICKLWSAPERLVIWKNGLSAAHRLCQREHNRQAYIDKALVAGHPIRKSRYQPGHPGRCSAIEQESHEQEAAA